jgi:hypothetical protein
MDYSPVIKVHADERVRRSPLPESVRTTFFKSDQAPSGRAGIDQPLVGLLAGFGRNFAPVVVQEVRQQCLAVWAEIC